MTETRWLTAILAAAKIRAGKVAAIASQSHGAIGLIHGHDLPRLTRRLWSWRDEFANESRWSLELGKQVIAACATALWLTIAGR